MPSSEERPKMDPWRSLKEIAQFKDNSTDKDILSEKSEVKCWQGEVLASST